MTQAARQATWFWRPTTAPAILISFLRTWEVSEVFVGVPWTGPDSSVIATAKALRAAGVTVSCLGGDPCWAESPELAAAWVARAWDGGLFTGIHLDIEPWTLPSWRGHEDDLLAGIAFAIQSAQLASAGHDATEPHQHFPVDVDLPAWVAIDHPIGFSRVAQAADRLTIMAYRDRATDILAFAAEARRLATSATCDYRVGVETLPSPEPRTTFADDSIGVLRRELATVATALSEDPACRGLAVHDITGWQQLAIRSQSR